MCVCVCVCVCVCIVYKIFGESISDIYFCIPPETANIDLENDL